MNMRKSKLILIVTSLVILLPMAVGLVCWERLPEEMVNHWDFTGQPDGWCPRPMAVFGLPLILLLGHWFCVFCTARDSHNREQDGKILGVVLWICPAVSLFAGGMLYTHALGYEVSVNAVCLFLGALFLLLGNYLPKCRPNHTIGIKISWTMKSQAVWARTHRMAGKLWCLCGLVLLLAGFLPQAFTPWILAVCLLPGCLAPVLYARYHYRRLYPSGQPDPTDFPK